MPEISDQQLTQYYSDKEKGLVPTFDNKDRESAKAFVEYFNQLYGAEIFMVEEVLTYRIKSTKTTEPLPQ